jgi:hypothetical protein
VALLHEGLSIVVPSQKNIFVGLFLAVWLSGWTVGGMTAFQTFMGWSPVWSSGGIHNSGGHAFLGFWLCGWLIGECIAIYTLLWMLVGEEQISIDYSALRYRSSTAGIGQTKAYNLSEVKNLRSEPTASLYANNRYGSAPLDKASIAFDYGRGTVKMAKGIDPVEANSILQEIYAYNPALRLLTQR